MYCAMIISSMAMEEELVIRKGCYKAHPLFPSPHHCQERNEAAEREKDSTRPTTTYKDHREMELGVLLLLLLLVIPASLAQEDLEGKMFVFPKETNTAHAVIRPQIAERLKKISVCLHSYSEVPRAHSLFSLATQDYSDAFLIMLQPLYTYNLAINYGKFVINTDTEPSDWRHTCVTWDSDTGLVQLWVNGKLYSGGVYMQGTSIAAETIVILGQRQNFFGKVFYDYQSLVGEISDVHMWDYVLASEDIQKVISGDLQGNIINWKSLVYEMQGEASVKPKLQHLERKMFFFPKETKSAHVVLSPTITQPLQKVSVCLRSYTELKRNYAVFSIATPGKDNAFLIFLQPPNTYSVYINQESVGFITDSEPLDWRHTCVTWNSDTGVVQLWVNGKLYSGTVPTKGSSISAETSIVLGQEQDSFGGGFDAAQSLLGEIRDVHMWDYVLTLEDVRKVISGDLHGNVINWISLPYEIKGEVLVKPKLHHMEGKMFVFPKETNTTHVVLRPAIPGPLGKVSFCLNAYTRLSRASSFFFSPIPRKSFQISFQPPYAYTLDLMDGTFSFQTGLVSFWRHVCVTWKAINGKPHLWVDGRRYEASNSQYTSAAIPAETSFILGQQRDYSNGGFQASRSFVGEMSDIHMWDYDLTEEDIQKVISGDLHGNILNWKSLLCEINGDVLVKPQTQRMENKVFVFPKESSSAHVTLRPSVTKSWQKVSVCLRSYTDLSRTYSLFSIATPGKDNAFLIFMQPPNTCSVYINQEVTSFRTDSESVAWRHTCVTWDSDTGVLQLWVNGKLYPRKGSMKGSSIAQESSIVLGQEQDSLGGGFDASQSFIGEIRDVHVWDYILTPEEVQKYFSGLLNGNIINWISLVYERKGDVIVQPKHL